MARKKKNSSLGCLFWIALILLVLVVFLFSRERISTVLETTGFEKLLKTVQDDERSPEVTRVSPEEEQPERKPKPAAPEIPEETVQTLPVEELTADDVEEKTDPAENKPAVEQKLRTSILFFVKVDDSGAISLQHVSRPVYYESSPLTRTMEALLAGLTSAELNSGMLSLIPEETRILSVSVKNEVAFIDFSEAFTFNEFGAEGAQAALEQVVYTATEFSTVKAVQITINGKRRNYLVSEGTSIAEPLSRDSL
jgi:spore germination protein GerM